MTNQRRTAGPEDAGEENGSAADGERTHPPFAGMHRLAAVWFADIVGYTRLSSEDETTALRLVHLFREVVRNTVADSDGHLVKFVGDAVLVEFGSTEVAVRAALELQRAFAERSAEAGVPARLRVGVHVGDVATSADGDIYGDGVNRAARLQSIALPGTVLVGEDVWRQLRQRPEFRFTEQGQRSLRGISEPVRVFVVALRDEPSPTRPVPGPSPRPGRERARRGAGFVLTLLAGVALYLGGEWILDSSSDGGLNPNLVAIVPLNVPSADPELEGWSEHFVVLLSWNLDGAGPLSTVPPSVSIDGWSGRADRSTATALGKRTGAGLVIYGNFTPSGERSARVGATIWDVANRRVVAEVALDAVDPAERMVQLSDSLSLLLLEALGEVRPIGAVRQTPVTALTSGPSLKAFLRGEQFYRRTAWDQAIAEYRRALEADSTFAPALRRIGWALSWQGSVTDSVVVDYKLRAGAHNRGLPRYDSLLVAADSLGAAAERARQDRRFGGREYWGFVRRLFATLGTVTEQYPQSAEAWYALGDARYHYGFGPAATTVEAIMDAFDRSIELDSALAPVYLHPIELGLRIGGRSMGLAYARKYLDLDPTDVNAEGVRIAAQLTDPRFARSAATQRMLDSASTDGLIAGLLLVNDWTDSLETVVRLGERIALRRGARPTWAATCRETLEYLPALLAHRGRLGAARCALGQDPPDGSLLPALALLDALPADSASAIFDGWLRRDGPFASFALPWWAARGDTASIRALLARAESRRRAGPDERSRQRGTYDAAAARAYLALVRGDTAEATPRFEALPDTLCFSCFELDKLTLARLLARQRRYSEAYGILSSWGGPYVSVIDVLVELERGRVAERLGDHDGAIAAYRYVVDAWLHADPGLRPLVEEARRALQRRAAPARRGGLS